MDSGALILQFWRQMLDASFQAMGTTVTQIPVSAPRARTKLLTTVNFVRKTQVMVVELVTRFTETGKVTATGMIVLVSSGPLA